jgi:hypothetical protein
VTDLQIAFGQIPLLRSCGAASGNAQAGARLSAVLPSGLRP